MANQNNWYAGEMVIVKETRSLGDEVLGGGIGRTMARGSILQSTQQV